MALADTGLSAETLCDLNRENLDLRRKRIQTKNQKGENSSIRISLRLQDVLSIYLQERLDYDIATGHNIQLLPIFARHDRGVGRKTEKITPTTVRNTVSQCVKQALGVEAVGKITPHTFRSYFIANLLQDSLDILHPKILNKCQNLFESGQYDEAIFVSMKVVEQEVRSLAAADSTDIGVQLISKAMSPINPVISFSSIEAEQKSAFLLYSGAIGTFKNPLSHRFLETSDPVKTFECLAFASLLIRMLDQVTK